MVAKSIVASGVIAAALTMSGCRGGGGVVAQPPPPPLQMVRVVWCLLDDGRTFPPPRRFFGPQKSGLQNPNAPQFRFNGRLLLAGLQAKNRIFASAGIQFVSAGSVIVADPQPNYPPFAEGGEIGDVVDPGEGLRRTDQDELPLSPGASQLFNGSPVLPNRVGRMQVRAVVAACLKKIGPVAPEMLVEIVIRRFVSGVDQDGDGRFDEDTAGDGVDDDARLFGILRDGDGEDPIVTAPLLGLGGNGFAMVVDPEAVPAPALGVNLGRLRRFGQVLAHENGHALGLAHAAGPPAPRLMSATVPPWGQVALTGPEIRTVQAAAAKLSHTVEKDENGVQHLRDRPLARVAVDALEDAGTPWSDILSLEATRRLDGGLTLKLRLNGLIPPQLQAPPDFRFLLDVDANADTGSPGEGFDLALLLETAEGKMHISGRQHRGGRWREPRDYGPRAEIRREFYAAANGSAPLLDAVVATLQAEHLPLPLAEGFRVTASSGDGHGNVADRAPVVRGTLVQFKPQTTLEASPMVLGKGAAVRLRGAGFARDDNVAVFLGERLVATAATDSRGAFDLSVDVPPVNAVTDIAFADGSRVVPLMVADADGVSELCWLVRQ